MIGKFIAKVFRGTRAGRSLSSSKKMLRRIAIEPLETRRLLSVTSSISGHVYLDPQNSSAMTAGDAGFAGITVNLESVGSQGDLSSVSGVGPVQTNSDGSYSFSNLAAGTYQVQIEPSSKLAVGKLSPGSAGGTAGNDEIQVTLAAGQSATDYNFAILGAQTNEISLRMFMSSTGSLTHFLTTMHSKPSVEPGSSGSATYSTTYTTGGPAAAVVSSTATILSTDSPTLASMTVTIENPLDGSSEQLSADTTGTTLTSNYANGVLTVSGVADVFTYETVLQSVQYSDSASPATVGDRTISITVNDGTDTSTAATSTISVVQGANTVPAVTTQPAAQTVDAGGTATFTAAASGYPTPSVQWEVNTGSGTFSDVTDTGVYSGSGSGTLTITGATSAMNGYQYEAVFTNAAGSVTSTAATLTVQTVQAAPVVTTQPTAQAVVVGGTTTFTAAASGTPTPTVQWEVNTGSGGFTDLTDAGVYSGSSTDTLTITGATSAMNGYQYEAVFTNTAGGVTTSAVTLTVETATAPSVTTQPTAQTALTNGTATFTAAASGVPTPTVQWEVNTGSGTFAAVSDTGVYSGATTGTLTITDPTLTMNGYQYEAVFTNSVSSATSSAAALTVETATAPSITTQPTAQTALTNGTATFTAAASGTPTPTVQWEVNTGSGTFAAVSDTGVYSGATTGTLTITDPTSPMNGYKYEAVFTNSVSSATSSAVGLTVETATAPSITTQPTAQTALTTGTATFTAAASGTPTPTVQWEVNTGSGTFAAVSDTGVYSGATTDALTITDPTLTMNGYQYEAVFTNSVSSATSSAVGLTVETAIGPSVTTQPTAQTALTNSTATFTAAAGGIPNPTVQWEVNTGSGTFTAVSDNAVYSGATTDALTITDPTLTMNGYQYKAVFSNSVSSATSSAAELTVETAAAPSVTTQPTAQSVLTTGTATFTAGADGTPAPTVQWEVNTGSGTFTDVSNNTVYSGATTDTLTITDPTSTMNGYQYKADFTNTSGNATTAPAVLTVETTTAPSMTTQPTAQSVVEGGTTTFTAAASGTPTPTVQWEVNTGSGTFADVSDTGVYSGATTGTLTITGATLTMNGYQYEAVFTNSAGNVTSYGGRPDRRDSDRPERDRAAGGPDRRHGRNDGLHGGGQRRSQSHGAVGGQYRQRDLRRRERHGRLQRRDHRHADHHRRHVDDERLPVRGGLHQLGGQRHLHGGRPDG